MCIPIASIGIEISCLARMVDDLLSDLTYEVERELELEADAKKSAIRAATRGSCPRPRLATPRGGRAGPDGGRLRQPDDNDRPGHLLSRGHRPLSSRDVQPLHGPAEPGRGGGPDAAPSAHRYKFQGRDERLPERRGTRDGARRIGRGPIPGHAMGLSEAAEHGQRLCHQRAGEPASNRPEPTKPSGNVCCWPLADLVWLQRDVRF